MVSNIYFIRYVFNLQMDYYLRAQRTNFGWFPQSVSNFVQFGWFYLKYDISQMWTSELRNILYTIHTHIHFNPPDLVFFFSLKMFCCRCYCRHWHHVCFINRKAIESIHIFSHLNQTHNGFIHLTEFHDTTKITS